MTMTAEKAQQLFGLKNKNERFFYAMVPRCVILDPNLSVWAKQVYFYLIARAGSEDVTWISQKIITIDLNCSPRQVKKCIADLLQAGLISVEKQPHTNSNVYFIEDVVTVYGEKATAKWPKREYYESRDATEMGGGGAQPCTTMGHNRALPMGHNRALPVGHNHAPKEEESFEQEIHEQEICTIVPSADGSHMALPIEKKRYIGKFETSDLELGIEWLAFALEIMPWQKTWTAEKFATELAKLRRVTEVSHEGLRQVFDFIKKDKFWREVAVSPARLAMKTKGEDVRKIDWILSQVTKSQRKNMKIAAMANANEDPF